MSLFLLGRVLTSGILPVVSCDNRGMNSFWRRGLAATSALALALACANCGGGAAGSTGSSSGGSGAASGGSSSGGSSGSGSGGSSSGGNSGSGSGSGPNSQSACGAMSTGLGASLNGFRPFGDDNLWNQDISAAAVDANSDAIINFIGPTVGMHADFGSGEYQGSNIGIP